MELPDMNTYESLTRKKLRSKSIFSAKPSHMTFRLFSSLMSDSAFRSWVFHYTIIIHSLYNAVADQIKNSCLRSFGR